VRLSRYAIRTLAGVGVAALLAAGCSRAGGGTAASGGGTPGASASAGAPASGSAAGGFGTLSNVCHGGSVSGGTAQGVTASSIKVGVMTDMGYTKDPQLENAARVFTDWCDANGGINGRKLVPDIHDTQMMQVVQATTSACASDFALVGGSAALDGLAVKTRLQCLLPDFDAQAIMPEAVNSDLQVTAIHQSHEYSQYTGYYAWLLKQYPGSAASLGVLGGQSTITQIDDEISALTMQADGGKVTYDQQYPIIGVTNWTPYAEAIKAKGVKGLTFYGTPEQLASLEQALDNIGYNLDWIDTNTNAYGTSFIQIAGKALSQQHNYAQLPAVYPVEKAASNPATEQVVKLFQQYAPGQPVTLQDLQAFSVWLLFADSAQACGSNLTRTCVYDAAVKQTAWTGGGLTAPVNEGQPSAPPTCFNIEQASPSGWSPAPIDPNTDGAYRCGETVLKLPSAFPQPLTLASVGKSLSDLK
jgi:substrate-binding family protein